MRPPLPKRCRRFDGGRMATERTALTRRTRCGIAVATLPAAALAECAGALAQRPLQVSPRAGLGHDDGRER
jgi:hypothetical protein